MCRAVLAPLKPALWSRLRTLRAPELRRLRRRQIALRAEAGPPGAQGAGPEGQGPAPAVRSRIHARLEHLHAACSPRRKVALLLAMCSDIYAGLARGENQGKGGVCVYLDVEWLGGGGNQVGGACARTSRREGGMLQWQVSMRPREGQPAPSALGTRWEVSTRPHLPQSLSSRCPRAHGGRRLPAGADGGADLESAHWGDAAGRGVSHGALGSG